MTEEEHVIQLKQVAYPEGRNQLWVAVCSCGKYRSTVHAYAGYAERDGRQHVRAKEMHRGR